MGGNAIQSVGKDKPAKFLDRLKYKIFIPKPVARFATATPILPMPTIPMVAPAMALPKKIMFSYAL
jgi:hypothetical protein